MEEMESGYLRHKKSRDIKISDEKLSNTFDYSVIGLSSPLQQYRFWRVMKRLTEFEVGWILDVLERQAPQCLTSHDNIDCRNWMDVGDTCEVEMYLIDNQTIEDLIKYGTVLITKRGGNADGLT